MNLETYNTHWILALKRTVPRNGLRKAATVNQQHYHGQKVLRVHSALPENVRKAPSDFSQIPF